MQKKKRKEEEEAMNLKGKKFDKSTLISTARAPPSNSPL